MSPLEIVHFPDPRLRVKTQPVVAFDQALSAFIDAMFATMYAAPGVGLAATQVGDARRVAVMDCSEAKNERIVLCNPRIVEARDLQPVQEGCLSVPDHFDTVPRYAWVRFTAQDRDGTAYEMEAEGLLAQCVQHETAHLDGELYIDKLSRLKRERIRRKRLKAMRHAATARAPGP